MAGSHFTPFGWVNQNERLGRTRRCDSRRRNRPFELPDAPVAVRYQASVITTAMHEWL
jgi:hypothetical protein